MKRLALAVLLAFTAGGCPDPQTGKVDPYLTARTIIIQANTALALADGIFNQWLVGQSDADKAKKAQTVYQRAKTGVANGLQLALNGVALAQQAKEDPNIKSLMSEANNAWGNLRKFLEDLLAKPEDSALVAVGTPAAPTTDKVAGGISSRASALTARRSPLEALPKKLH